MFKAVITDFDGVLRHWNNDKTRKVEADCKLEFGTLSRICFSEDLLQPAITGKSTFESWVNSVRERLIKAYGLGVAEHYVEAWLTADYSIDYDLIKQYRELFPETRLVLATNATSRLPLELRNAKLDLAFDSVYNSSAMGVAKPKTLYFQAMLMSMGFTAKEVIFIDDSPANVQAAKSLGITSCLYNGRSELLESLTSISLQASVMEV
jgi:putative hydrolase of the HAD superfamily